MASIKDGKPHIVPVWFYYDGTNIIVPSAKDTKKTKNLQNNPNVSIVIDVVEGKSGDLSFFNGKAMIVEGVVEIRDEIDNNSFAKKTYKRYVGKSALDNPFIQFSVNLPRCILVIKPTKIISWDFSKIPPLE
jgi:Pyridoxamine 5'-phosphate oxidase